MKKITTLFVAFAFVLFAGESFAQWNQVWNNHYQHTILPGYSNEGRKVVEDPSGNIFMVADVSSDIDPNGFHGMSTYHYVVINKYSSTGTLLNTINIDVQKQIVAGFNLSSAFGLEVDAAGNIYVGYCTWSSGSSFDVVLEKLDNTLVPVWKNTYGGNGTETGVAMKLHPSGTIYAVVKVTNIMTSYSVIKSVNSNSNSVLVYAYPINGEVINSIALDGGQRAYVAGYKSKNGNKDAYVGEINIANNTLVWGSVYSPTAINNDDVANSITVGVDGKIYTVGTTYQGNLFQNQPVVLRNSPGNPRFDYAVVLKTSVIKNKGLQINASESGWVYVGSASDSLVTIFRFPSNGVFSSPGKVLLPLIPVSPYSNTTEVSLTGMKVSSSKNIYVTGSISSNGPSGPFVSSYLYKASVVFGNALVKVGGVAVEGDFDKNYEGVDLALDYAKTDVYWIRNYWNDAHTDERVEVIDVNAPAPLREASELQLSNKVSISINPNPASEKAMIQSTENMNSVEVLDLTGNRVMYTVADSKEKELNLSSLSTGIYFCKVRTEAGEVVKKLIVN